MQRNRLAQLLKIWMMPETPGYLPICFRYF